jgi:hypothetical protein
VIWLRWIREAVNALWPASGVGGDLVCMRLARLRGVLQTEAAASMIVDVTVGAVTQLLFAALGTVLLLLGRSTAPRRISPRAAKTTALDRPQCRAGQLPRDLRAQGR